jgi:D-glycero-alpha-D-manno-heptose-7-phosphate kinase
MQPGEKPRFVINCFAPNRICDLGGWTDTWFAGSGNVLNLAVYPGVEVQIAGYAAQVSQEIWINPVNIGERYCYRPQDGWNRNPLLEATIDRMKLPAGQGLEITIQSETPPGASMGTSASVVVALIGGLDWLTPGRMTPHEVAMAAQAVETEMLGQQCGIQDQLCAAYGGIREISMFAYPQANVSPVPVRQADLWELERRLILVYLDKVHRSTEVHEMVIHSLEAAGPTNQALEDLRLCARRGREALVQGDLFEFGAAMAANTEAQARLHPGLVSPDAWKIIDIAKDHGALGWKINGAGGDGGSLTLLCSSAAIQQHQLIHELNCLKPEIRAAGIRLCSSGLRVWAGSAV